MDEHEIGGYAFRDRRLLEAALTHTSYLHEHPELDGEHFERLEFLGDALVDLLVAEELYRRFPSAREGELTERRAALVSAPALTQLAVRLGLLGLTRFGRGAHDYGETRFAGGIYEAVVAAVYLDGGLEAARAFIRGTMADDFERPSYRSAKTVLQEWAQATLREAPAYRQLEVLGPEHRREFVFEVALAGRTARGSGSSIREAQESAASRLLEEVTR